MDLFSPNGLFSDFDLQIRHDSPGWRAPRPDERKASRSQRDPRGLRPRDGRFTLNRAVGPALVVDRVQAERDVSPQLSALAG